MVAPYTVGAWGLIAAISAGYWYLSKPKPQSKLSQKELRDRERAKSSHKEKENKPRKSRSTGESSGRSSGNEAQKRNKTSKEAGKAEQTATSYQDSPDDKLDDREFARQLSNAKTGTTMAPKNETGSRQKSVKLSKAMTSDDDTMKRVNAEQGSDGDDDLSSVASPEFNATVPKAGDVSDMLESSISGPSILRLTQPATTQPSKSKKAAPKPKEPELTKKQRQNQAKREAAKAANEEIEKERRALEEKQRRTAREAEGRAAKDGSSTLYSPPPPKTNAWTDANTQNGPKNSKNVQLLDTYLSNAADSRTGSDEAQNNHQPAASQPRAPSPVRAAASLDQYSDLPSEEEQIRILSENDGWNEVKPKKSKAKVAKKISSEVLPSENTNGSKFDNFEVEA